MNPTDTVVAGPGARFYKSDLRPLPVIFVQNARSWGSYTPGGAMLEYCPGVIPEGRLAGLEEIDEAEGRRWLSAEASRAPGQGSVLLLDGPGAASAQPIVFQPRRWRQWVFGPPMLFVLLYGVFAAVMVARGSNADVSLRKELLFGLMLLLVVLCAVTVSLFKGRLSTYAITLSGASIAAQTGFWRERSAGILLDEINRSRSARRSSTDRLLGRHCLYTRSGVRVVFVRRYFDAEVTRDLLGRLGISSE